LTEQIHPFAHHSADSGVSDPLRVDHVELASVTRLRGVADAAGSLGMTFTPGKHDVGRSRTHRRDLAADIATLRDEHRADAFVLLIEDRELTQLRFPGLPDAVADAGIALIRYPIPDGKVPVDRSTFRSMLDGLLARLARGQRVVVACRGGLGRTGTVVWCLLRDGGLDGSAAIALTRATRHGAIETEAQERFVRAWDWPDRPVPA
jgi:protein-tyrosine phosphatase